MASEIDKLEALAADVLRRCNVCKPGVVESYIAVGPGAGLARIAVGWLGQTPFGTPDKPLILPSVPVVWQRGAGVGFVGSLVPGDTVLVVIADRSIDEWSIAGGVVPLASDRMHHVFDAIAIPGLYPTARPPSPAAATAAQIGREDGTCTVAIPYAGPGAFMVTADTIALGGPAAVLRVAIAEQVHAFLVAMLTTGLPVPNDGGAALQTAWLAYLAAHPATEFASTKVTAE